MQDIIYVAKPNYVVELCRAWPTEEGPVPHDYPEIWDFERGFDNQEEAIAYANELATVHKNVRVVSNAKQEDAP